MARCRPVDRGANNSWGVPNVLYDPQTLNYFLPGSIKVWEPFPSSELRQPAVAVPEGSRGGGGAAAGPARDLLQQCLWAAGITQQLLEAEARRDPSGFQPSVPSLSAPQMFPGGAWGQQLLLQPFVQHLGPTAGPRLGGGQRAAAALPAPQVVILQQVPQRIILQVKQPGPTTLALLPSPASCVPGSSQGPGPPAHKPSGHPITLRPPAPRSSSTPAQRHPQGCGS